MSVDRREEVMKRWARRLRAAVGMGLTWAVAWSAVGAVLARLPGVDSDLPLPLLFGPLGFISGVIFSGILVGIGSRRQFDRTSLPRFAALGGASGLLLSGIFAVGAVLRGAPFWGEFLLFGPPLAIASSVCAAGSLALARRGERERVPSVHDPEPSLPRRSRIIE